MRSTIHSMVYNAIKLFNEISPETFEAVQSNYKEQRRQSVYVLEILTVKLILNRDAEKAQIRYDEWLALRDQAIANYKAAGLPEPLPKSLTEPPLPRPEPFKEEDFGDVSIDITANGLDVSESFTLDRAMAEEMVPMADPGVDRPHVSDPLFA